MSDTQHDRCPECNHGHELPAPCPACDEAAQLGQPAPCQIVDPLAPASGGAEGLPDGATIEPWTDEDTAELGEAMSVARAEIGRHWSLALAASRTGRLQRIAAARLTRDELATAAARFGIVADGWALPRSAIRPATWSDTGAAIHEAPDPFRAEAAARQSSTGDVWDSVVAARAGKTTHGTRPYESADAFEERHTGGLVWIGPDALGATVARGPVYASGIASSARVVRS